MTCSWPARASAWRRWTTCWATGSLPSCGTGTFEHRIHTLGAVESVAPGYIRITGRQGGVIGVRYDAALGLEYENVAPSETSRWTAPMTRIRFISKAAEGRIALRIVPE